VFCYIKTRVWCYVIFSLKVHNSGHDLLTVSGPSRLTRIVPVFPYIACAPLNRRPSRVSVRETNERALKLGLTVLSYTRALFIRSLYKALGQLDMRDFGKLAITVAKQVRFDSPSHKLGAHAEKHM
jgi:hypothetical protein